MSKNTPQNNQQTVPTWTAKDGRPRILILEALSGSSQAVFEAGGVPIKVGPREVRCLDVIESGEWDGLLLTGGADVDPRRYGEKPHRNVYGVNETRDEVEIYALEAAREWGLPVLGICRGAQIINVEAGGTLEQDIRGHRGGIHLLLTEQGSMMRTIAPQTNKYVVTLHHQCMKRVAPGFTISGIAPDGTPEAIESDDKRCLGVQFHPEMDKHRPYARSIFRWLVIASARVNGMLDPPTRYPSYQSYSQPKKQKGKNRSAGQRTQPKKQKKQNRQGQLALVEATKQQRVSVPGMAVSWACRDPYCSIVFDHIADRDDHERVLHGFTAADLKAVT